MDSVAKSKKEQREYGSLKVELARIGDLIEKGKSRLASLAVDEKEEKRLLEALPQLQKQEQEILATISRLRGQETEARAAADRAKRDFEKVDGAYKATSTLHGEATGKTAHVGRQVNNLEQTKASLEASTKEKTREKTGKESKDIVDANSELGRIRAEITQATKELEDMTTNRKKAKEISADLTAANKRLKDLSGEIAGLEKVKGAKAKQVDALDESMAKKRQTHDEYIAAENKKLADREKGLLEREGDVNRQKQWIIGKAGLLRQAKRELEEFHGKILRHIVIPDIEGEK